MQHLNLYTQLDRATEPPFSARQQVTIVGLAIVLMLIVFVVSVVDKNSAANELQRLQAEQELIDQSVQELQNQKTRLEKNEALDKKIATLENEINFRYQLLESIGTGDKSAKGGFSTHLQSLARQHVDGMWFTEIRLLEGGNELALSGQTRRPEFVPRYLQKLSSEAAFTGHQFRVLRLNTPTDRNDVLDFELRANEVGQP